MAPVGFTPAAHDGDGLQIVDTCSVCMLGAMSTPETPPPAPPASKPTQPRNPLHGVTLEAMVVGLADYFGWDELGQQIDRKSVV